MVTSTGIELELFIEALDRIRLDPKLWASIVFLSNKTSDLSSLVYSGTIFRL